MTWMMTQMNDDINDNVDCDVDHNIDVDVDFKPHDDKVLSSRHICLSRSHTHDRLFYSFGTLFLFIFL